MTARRCFPTSTPAPGAPTGNAAVYAKVFATLTETLAAGTVPWAAEWRASRHMNAFTRRPYHGGNILAVMIAAWVRGFTSPGWGTWNQIAKAGGRVRKGEEKRYTWVYLMRTGTKRPKAGAAPDAEPETFFMARAFHIYNLDQCEGVEAIAEKVAGGWAYDGDPHADADAMMTRLGVPVVDGAQPAYSPVHDRITMPPRRRFKSKEGYYATLFHEATHATGHPTRLDRDNRLVRFGSPEYAFEELVAELGALFLATDFGFSPVSQSAAYLASWQRAIKDDATALARAAAEAAKACAFLGAPSTLVAVEEAADEAAEVAA